MLGITFALLAAASFGLNGATLRRGVLTGSVVQALSLSIPIGFAMFLAVAVASGQLTRIGELPADAWPLLMATGLVHFIFGRYCNYRAIQAMGNNLATPVQQLTLLVSLSMALVFLGERLTGLMTLGILVMVFGPAWVFHSRRRRGAPAAPQSAGAAASPAPAFQPRLVEGYLFALLSCIGYGATPVMVRAALDGTGLAIAGGVVSYATATVVIALVLAWPSTRRDVAGMRWASAKWFAIAGGTVGMSQMFLYVALSLAPVTVVQPLMQFYAVFRTLFSWALNPTQEAFDASLLAVIAISIFGALAIILDSAMVAAALGAPPWLETVLTASWP